MQELKIYDDEIKLAKHRDELMGVLPSSKESGNGNVPGFLGEALVLREYGGILVDNFDYDIEISGLKADVKTKSVSSVPKPDYLCSVMEYQLDNKCDIYIFTRINMSKKIGWILGWIPKQDLISNGKVFKAGDKDGNFTVKENCVSIEISSLYNMDLICQ
jgi:hypothetical protein